VDGVVDNDDGVDDNDNDDNVNDDSVIMLMMIV